MRVTVQNTLADFNAFAEYHLERRLGRYYWFLRHALPSVLAVASIALLLLSFVPNILSVYDNLYMFIGGILGLCLSFCWSFWNALNSFLLYHRGESGNCFVLESRADGLLIQRGETQHTLAWTQFSDIERLLDHTVLLVDKRSGLIIPNRLFSTPAEADRFVHVVKTHWLSAKNATHSPLKVP